MVTGYTGIFYGTITYADGKPLILDDETQLVSDYFRSKDPEFFDNEFFEKISDQLYSYYADTFKCEKPYTYQIEFSGDAADGIIDFYMPKKMKRPKPMKFTFLDKEYMISWNYHHS
jgi:hypothetical protein